MNALFELAGIDFLQWKAVTRTLLRSDFRLPLAEGSSRGRRTGSLALMALFLMLFGTGAAVVVFVNPNVLLSATVALLYLSVMLMASLLTQHGVTMLSTADYAILGSRPVSSRTMLAIRVTNVLFHSFLVTTWTALPVIVAFAVAHGGSALRGVAAAIAIYGWALALTLAVIAPYGMALRRAGPARVQRALGYVQLAAGCLTYGGLLLAVRLLDSAPLTVATLPDAWWLLLVPPAWYASYVELAEGVANSTTTIRAVVSIASIAALAWAIRDKFGLDYARQLADLSTHVMSGAGAVRTPLFPRDEARAVAILVLAHFRHDLRVRMGILAIVPLLFIYLFAAPRDQSFDLVALAVLVFPAVLSRHFIGSEAHRASWIYYAVPVERSRLVRALNNVAVTYFLVPFLLLVFAVYLWRFSDLSRALIETATLGLLSHITLQGAVIISPRLPFAQPPDKTTGGITLTVWLAVVMLGGQGALYALHRWVFTSAAWTAATVMSLAVLTLLLNNVIAWRARQV